MHRQGVGFLFAFVLLCGTAHSVGQQQGCPIQIRSVTWHSRRPTTTPIPSQSGTLDVVVRNVSPREVEVLSFNVRSRIMFTGTAGPLFRDSTSTVEVRSQIKVNQGKKLRLKVGQNAADATVELVSVEFDDGSVWRSPQSELCNGKILP
jgi:hypothetical protein